MRTRTGAFARRADGLAEGLVAALCLRAPGLRDSTKMHGELAARVGRAMSLEDEDQVLLRLSVRVRDIGMLALPDAIVFATGALSPPEWEQLNRHPALGADLLETLEDLAEVAPIVRSHHERWDGMGYPDGLVAEEIPLLSRIVAVTDAFVAMVIDRPYRRAVTAESALDHVALERDRQFDPQVVDALLTAMTATTSHPDRPAGASVSAPDRPRREGPPAPPSLKEGLAHVAMIAAFQPAADRVTATLAHAQPSRQDLTAAIESDIGLTIAILRAVQPLSPRRPITNVADAVTALALEDIERTILALPLAAFPWRTASDQLLHRLRVHAQSVSRAVERIVGEIGRPDGDDILTAALLHDVGKLALAHSHPSLLDTVDGLHNTPEQRIKLERQRSGLDHASVGALLLKRWGLPQRLADTVASHHVARRGDDDATVVRLADMIAHHAHGDPVDRRLLLSLATECGLALDSLRETLYDLPHTGGSRRGRAAPSPLTARETDMIQGLANGKVYKQIAADVGLSTSTVRTHLHNAYQKLEVNDRAQAVLHATEMGWI